MAALELFTSFRTIDDDAISVASDCTLPDPIQFGAPLERMSFGDGECSYDSASVKSYASSHYPSCDYLPSSSCRDPDCDCQSSDDEDAPLHHPVIFDDEDEDVGLSPCASSTSSLSDHFQQPRRLSNAGDLAGVEHCDTPKVMRRLSNAAEGALPPRPDSPLEQVVPQTQQRIGTSDAHRHHLALARFLNAEPVRSDPWNHTIPVVHIREHTIANRTTGATLVTERLHNWWSLPFANVRDCIDYTKQVLEGVAFLHENQITNLAEAVRPHNIQMDTGLAPVCPPTLPARTSTSAPVTPSTESEDLPPVAWSRGDFPVRYYFTATSGMHRVRRLSKEGTRADLVEGDDLEASSMELHVTELDHDDDEEEEDEAVARLQELDTLSRTVDDDMWEASVAVDLVALGNSLDLVFGKMPFNHLRPIIQDLCDAFDTDLSAHDALSRVEDLERALPSHELLRSISFDD